MAIYNTITGFLYNTPDFQNIELVDFEVQGDTSFTVPLNITPLPTETEIVFWQRAQTELNVALQNEFWYLTPILFDPPDNTTIPGRTIVNPVLLNGGYTTKSIVIRMFVNFTNGLQNFSINFAFSTDDLSAATATSYNNEIARSQDDVPPLVN